MVTKVFSAIFPISDIPLLRESIKKLTMTLSNLKIQEKKRDESAKNINTDDLIIAELDKLIKSGTLVKRSNESLIQELENGFGDLTLSVKTLYSPKDTNPAASKIFEKNGTVNDVTMQYGNNSAEMVMYIAKRLKIIMIQMQNNTSLSQAFALNTYARAEMARIMALRLRMTGVQDQQISTELIQDTAAREKERVFFRFIGQKN